MEVIEAIKDSTVKTFNSVLIKWIYQHLKTVDHWLRQHIRREENRETDRMVKLAFDREK